MGHSSWNIEVYGFVLIKNGGHDSGAGRSVRLLVDEGYIKKEIKMGGKIRQNMLSNQEISAFCEQMAMVLKAGISVLEGISVMKEDAQTSAEQELLDMICQKVQETGALASSLEETGVFPEYLCKMVQIGEETGTLDEVLSSLERYYERQETIAESIRSALVYPLIMTGMMALVIVVLLTRVMPVFQQVFRQLGTEMSGFSRGALLLGNALSRYAVLFTGIIAALALLFIWFVKTKSERAKLEKLGRHFRLFREISDQMAACRFAGGMSLTLKSGLMPERGLELAEELNENQYFGERISSCKKMMEEGDSMSEAFKRTKIFTGVYARMVDIAGRTGVMDEVMGKLSDQLEEEIDGKINGFIAMLEPTLVIFLSLIVGAILLSVMLPLLGILAGI